MPLSVTVTTKLSAPLKPGAGVYVANPLGLTVAKPGAGGVLTLNACVWPISGSLALILLLPGVFCGVLMAKAMGAGARFPWSTVQRKARLVLASPSDTVTMTLYGLPTAAPFAIVPLTMPVVVLILSPGGSFMALKLSVSPSTSLALMLSATVDPSCEVWSPGDISDWCIIDWSHYDRNGHCA